MIELQRPKENSKEYNEFLDGYKTNEGLPYYLYTGQTDTRKKNVPWCDLTAFNGLKQIAPTGSIYLRHEKVEMLCWVTENKDYPGFAISVKDENGTPREIHIYLDPRTNELIVATNKRTCEFTGDSICKRYPIPFKNVTCTRAYLLLHSNTPFPEEAARLSVDSIAITVNEKTIRLGYAEIATTKCSETDYLIQMKEPDYYTFPEMQTLTREDLLSIESIDEIILETGDADLGKALHIKELTFALPYEDFENITVASSALENTVIETVE